MATESMSRSTVLVTGGTGYLATWIIIELLRRGYEVRTTVRDLGRSGEVRHAVAGHVEPGRLSFVRADLLRDEGWDDAVSGVDYVLHVASPLPLGEFRKKDLVRPAREGMRRVLTAASKADVRRTVVTSSTEAAKPARDEIMADETVWADPPDKPAYTYPRSKVLAERDAWAFIAETGTAMELVTVLPAFIEGPVLGKTYARSSVEVIRLMLDGQMPAVPNVGWNMVDVRDLAALHVQALSAPGAAGHRLLAAGDFLWMREIARLLKTDLGPQAAKVRTRRLPDTVVRLGAMFNPELAQIRINLNRHVRIDTSKTQELLGWRPRPAEQSIRDAARSLIDYGIVAS